MERQERLLKAYEYLRNKGVLHTQRNLAERMRTNEGNVSKALKGVENILTDGFLRRFNRAFGNIFSIDWLLRGEGEMLLEPETPAPTAAPTRKERLGRAIEYLRGQGLIHKQRDIAEKMGSSAANISKALAGEEASLTDNFLRRFNAAYGHPFSPDWLIFGTGEMFAPEEEETTENELRCDLNYLRGKLDGFREAIELLHGQTGVERKKGIV